MRKILIALLGVLLVAALAGAGTFAYFSDTETSSGNTFTAGTVDISLDGSASGGEAYFSVGNMAPGDTVTKYVEVRNDGSLDLLFRAYVDNVTKDTPVGADTFSDQLQVTVTLRPTGYTYPQGYNPYGPPNAIIYTGPLSGLIGENHALNNENAAFVDGWPLMPDYVAVYKIDVNLPAATGNDWRAAEFKGDLVVESVQFANQTQGNVVWP